MGSYGSTSRDAAFDGQIFPKGLNFKKSKYTDDLGTYQTTDAAVIRAGQLSTIDANGFYVPTTDGLGIVGVFKWDKQQFGVSVNVDEAVVLNGTTSVQLKRTAGVTNVSVRSAKNFGGTLYTVTTDYTATAGGLVTRVALGAIADGATVYVTYTYALVDADFQFDGRTFRNNTNDRVTGQENRVAIITNWSRLYTMEYDSSKQYGTASSYKLYATAEAKVSSTQTGSMEFVGRVHQLPMTGDEYLGMTIHGNPVA